MLHNPTFLLCGESGLEKIHIEALNDLRMMLLEPGTMFLTRKFEHDIVALLPKPESMIVNLVGTNGMSLGCTDSDIQA